MSLKSLTKSGFVCIATAALLVANYAQAQPPESETKETVGKHANGEIHLPIHQTLRPAGQQLELPGMRPQVLKISPDGAILVTSGKTHELVVVDPQTRQIISKVPLPSDKQDEPLADIVSDHILEPDKEGQVSYTGLIFSPDGKRIYLSNVNGSVKVFSVDGRKVQGLFSIKLPHTTLALRKAEIPAGLAISPDGKTLYVALNLSNKVLEIEAATGKQLRSFEVGVAPYDLQLLGSKLYVSNWGGRRPDATSVVGPAGRGTVVRVDPVRHIASEGSVSIIDLGKGIVKAELLTGLHASGLAIDVKQRYVAVANAGNDTITVIDSSSDKIVEQISLRWNPSDFFGASPNALLFHPNGRDLYVCNGSQNALAVVKFKAGKSKLTGLIPTGWYPGAVQFNRTGKEVYVANIKGIGAWKNYAAGEKSKFNSHQYFGTLSFIEIPTGKALKAQTETVFKLYRKSITEVAKLPARPGQKPVPVPERVGEPSVFKHVIYIIKENRTYDQVFGDIKEGNGDPSLTIFGEKITPNQHKVASEFVLLDNTYCSGILSADGHQWSDTGFATDYMERSFAGFPRSYPDGMEDSDIDALAYSPGGFIWDNVLKHGKTFRDYGEFTVGTCGWSDPHKKGSPKFIDYYNDFVNKTGLTRISSRTAINSITPHISTNTVGWDMDVPDVVRADRFIQELKAFEQKGEYPNFVVICLPNNHTSGTKAGSPTPAAHVADNDLAFGQIIEAVSKSKFWKETCIISIEDDPQDGWDHVTGYRTTAFVVSPYTKRKATVSVNYNHTSILRTIELILGLPPMTQLDAAATPMTACFMEVPDFTPFTAVPNNIPLDQLNPPKKALNDPVQLKYAIASERLNLKEPDKCPEDIFNRILWVAQKGSKAPYPKWAVRDADGD